MREWFRAFDAWARLAFRNFRQGRRDPDVVRLEKRAFRAGWRAGYAVEMAVMAVNGAVCVFPESIPENMRGYCSKCRRRLAYAQCRKCVARICVLCSWTEYPHGEDERCHPGCAK